MARDFDGSGDKLEYAGAITGSPGTPFSMACFFYPRATNVIYTLMALCTDGAATNQHILSANGPTDTLGYLACWSTASSSPSNQDTAPTTFSANAWHHACAVFASATSRTLYLDGVNCGTDGGIRTPGGMNRTRIGANGTSAAVMDGLIAEAAIWSVALSDSDVASLANGAHPLTVRPDAIIAYWPLYGTSDPELDDSGNGNTLAVTGTTTGEHAAKISALNFARRVLKAVATTILAGTATLVATATVLAAGTTPTVYGTATLPAAAYCTVAGTIVGTEVDGIATLPAGACCGAVGTVSTSPLVTLAGSGTVTAAGTISDSAHADLLGVATVGGFGTVSGDGRADLAGTAMVEAVGAMTGFMIPNGFSSGTPGTGDISWTHTPTSTAKGVLVGVVTNVGPAGATQVYYGTRLLTEVPGSPNVKTTGEPGVVQWFFAGTSLPTGPQTVHVIVPGGTIPRVAACLTIQAGADVGLLATDASINSDLIDTPTVNLALGGVQGYVVEAFHSGQQLISNVYPFYGWTDRLEYRFGAQVCGFYTYDTLSTADVVCGWNQSWEDGLMIAVALREITAVESHLGSAQIVGEGLVAELIFFGGMVYQVSPSGTVESPGVAEIAAAATVEAAGTVVAFIEGRANIIATAAVDSYVTIEETAYGDILAEATVSADGLCEATGAAQIDAGATVEADGTTSWPGLAEATISATATVSATGWAGRYGREVNRPSKARKGEATTRTASAKEETVLAGAGGYIAGGAVKPVNIYGPGTGYAKEESSTIV